MIKKGDKVTVNCGAGYLVLDNVTILYVPERLPNDVWIVENEAGAIYYCPASLAMIIKEKE